MGEQGPESSRGRIYFPETQVILDRLQEDPTEAFECSHGGEPAIEIAEVSRGCVALPGLETQALCPQHILTDGSFEGMHAVVDLSIDAAWSRRMGIQPDFCIMRDPDTGKLKLIPFDEFCAPASDATNI